MKMNLMTFSNAWEIKNKELRDKRKQRWKKQKLKIQMEMDREEQNKLQRTQLK